MILLPSRRIRVARVPFLFRASDCVDENGIFALSYGKRVAGVLSRPSRKRLVDQNGRQFVSPVGGVPLGRFGGEMAMLLENLGKNLYLRSQELDSVSWVKQNAATITPNAAVAPDGTLTMDLIVGDGSSSGQGVYQVVTFTGDGEKCVSWFLREGTGDTRNALTILDATVTVHRHLVRVTWTNGVPALSTISGAGTLYTPEYLHSGIWRIGFSATGVIAANANRVYLYTGAATAAAGTVYAWGGQPEDAVVPSSYIPTTTAAVTHLADSLYFDVPGLNPPRAMTAYVRGVEQSDPSVAGAGLQGVLAVADAAGAPPRIVTYKPSSIAGYRLRHDPATPTDSNSNPSVTRGDFVELRGALASTGVPTLGASKNGGAEVVGTPGAAQALGGAWSAARIYFNSTNGASSGLFAFTHIGIAEAEQERDELRELAGV